MFINNLPYMEHCLPANTYQSSAVCSPSVKFTQFERGNDVEFVAGRVCRSHSVLVNVDG